MAINTFELMTATFSQMLPALKNILSTAEASCAARIDKALTFMSGFTPEQYDGAETRKIELKFPNASFEFPGKEYLLGFVLPNFYFHMTTAYAILRHNGVDIGKREFLGG